MHFCLKNEETVVSRMNQCTIIVGEMSLINNKTMTETMIETTLQSLVGSAVLLAPPRHWLLLFCIYSVFMIGEGIGEATPLSTWSKDPFMGNWNSHLIYEEYSQCYCEGDGYIPWSFFDHHTQSFEYSFCKNGSLYLGTIQDYTMGCLYIPYPTETIALLANHEKCIGENMQFHDNTHGVAIGWDRQRWRNVFFEFCGKSSEPTCCDTQRTKGSASKGYCVVYILDEYFFRTTLSGKLMTLSKQQSLEYFSSNIGPKELLAEFLLLLAKTSTSKRTTAKSFRKIKNKDSKRWDMIDNVKRTEEYFPFDSVNPQEESSSATSNATSPTSPATTITVLQKTSNTAIASTTTVATSKPATKTTTTTTATAGLPTQTILAATNTLLVGPDENDGRKQNENNAKDGDEKENIKIETYSDDEKEDRMGGISKRTTLCIFEPKLCDIFLDWFE